MDTGNPEYNGRQSSIKYRGISTKPPEGLAVTVSGAAGLFHIIDLVDPDGNGPDWVTRPVGFTLGQAMMIELSFNNPAVWPGEFNWELSV